MVYAAIRIRGTINIKPDIKKTLHLLRLTRVNHCVLIPETPSAKGMLQMTKDYITWGELEEKTLTKLIKERGMLTGDQKITDTYLKKETTYPTIEQLSQAILDNKTHYKEIKDIKPLFRLHPPKKGYEGIKRSYTMGGALGYRGKDINTLIERML